MQLNHLDLPVPDVRSTATFFERFFGLRLVEMKGRDALAILKDEAGFTLVLSPVRKEGAQALPEPFHVGFHLDSEEEVRAMHARITGGGVERVSPLDHRRGALLFYCCAPGPVLVEVADRG
jgi:catechol 2,3-dioxygenase-like lactoylglutathione lyase family enzyme